MTAHNIHQLHSHNLCVTYSTGELGSLKSFEYHDVFGVELNSAEWVTAPLSLTHPQQVCAAKEESEGDDRADMSISLWDAEAAQGQL